MAHAILHTSQLAGTKLPSKLVNLKLTEDVDNGNIVAIGALANNEVEAFVATKPAVDSAITAVALVSAPEVMYDESKRDLADFYNKANTIVRGYLLTSGDEFALTADGFDGTPTVGGIIELQAGYKMKAVASATSGSTAIGKCIRIEGDKYIVRVD